MRTDGDACPVRGLEITLDVVEPHPAGDRLEKRLLAFCFPSSQALRRKLRHA
jgi:hypothetical protein